jgi:hypothetical protein
MVKVVLRRGGRVIRMRVVKTQEFGAKLHSAAFCVAIVLRPHQKSPAWAFFGGVRKGVGVNGPTVRSDQRPTAFVGIRLGAVLTNGVVNTSLEV